MHDQHEAIAQEMAAWPWIYPVVGELVALGFVASAYGRTEPGPPYLEPPTKFAYPPGGLRHPHHVNPAEGATFHIWSFSYDQGGPDDLRAQPVWFAGASDPLSLTPYRSRSGLTLDQAVETIQAMAAHHAQHFLTPEWQGGCPRLPVDQWREVLVLARAKAAAQAPAQLDLFAPPPTESAFILALSAALSAAGDVDAMTLRERLYEAEGWIHHANWARLQRGVPPVIQLSPRQHGRAA